MDILYIDKLTVLASIGVYNWEKECLQRLIFDLQLGYKKNFFENTIMLSSYLDYVEINKVILKLVSNRHFLLIEHVAEEVSKSLIEHFIMIRWIQVKVSKPRVIFNADNVSVCIERQRTW